MAERNGSARVTQSFYSDEAKRLFEDRYKARQSMIDIDKLVAGPELDALVAEKVMGWPKPEILGIDGRDVLFGDPRPDDENSVSMRVSGLRMLPHFSTDIAAAWEVVEKLKLAVSPAPLDRGWMAAPWTAYWDSSVTMTAETAPLAICLASLKAVGA